MLAIVKYLCLIACKGISESDAWAWGLKMFIGDRSLNYGRDAIDNVTYS